MSVLKRAFTDHKHLLMAGFVYMIAVVILSRMVGVPPQEYLLVIDGWISTIIFAFLAIAVVIASFLLRAIFSPHAEGRNYFRAVVDRFDALYKDYFDSNILVYGFVGLIVMLQVSFFFGAKSLIPYINPYRWDPLFAAIDKAIHFGVYPHLLAEKLIDSAGWQYLLDFSYQLWFVVVFAAVAYSLFYERNMALRLRFLWNYLLAWMVGGTVLAVFFSSVGPVYFHGFYPDLSDPYTNDIIRHLFTENLAPLRTVGIVLLLLEMDRNDVMFDINGLSAMPSMHVWIAWLAVLYTWSINRIVAAGFFVFAALIFIGSVYLGWHYAIDGYVSIILATLFWVISGRCFRQGERL